jgi:hypothetical protein
MSKKIKVIIKYVGEKIGHYEWINNDLQALQQKVQGYIEIVPICNDPHIVLVCNEEGKIRDLEHNFYYKGDSIVGDVVICGTKGEDLDDVPITLDTWGALLKMNGNDIGR